MDLFVTVISLLVAIYAVTPREGQLNIRLRFKAFDWLVIWCAFLGSLYLGNYSFFDTYGYAVAEKQWPKGLSPEKSVSLWIAGTALILFLRLRFSPSVAAAGTEIRRPWPGNAVERITLAVGDGFDGADQIDVDG